MFLVFRQDVSAARHFIIMLFCHVWPSSEKDAHRMILVIALGNIDFSYISMNCDVNFLSHNFDFSSEYFSSHNLRQFDLTFTLIILTFRLMILNFHLIILTLIFDIFNFSSHNLQFPSKNFDFSPVNFSSLNLRQFNLTFHLIILTLRPRILTHLIS